MTEHITETAAEIIRDLAHAQTDPAVLEPGVVYGWLSEGKVHVIDVTDDRYLGQPKRKAGTVIVRNVASFAHYYAKHATEVSEVFANLDEGTFTAVLDAHGRAPADTNWQEHRLVLQLEQTLPWKTWTERDRKMQAQQAFAEFVEDNARDVAPNGKTTAADLLEVAQSFQANTNVKFSKGTRLATGQTQFTYTEEIDAKAGKRGEITIPSEFDLAIVPYEDCAAKILGARFRYRLDGGELRLGYFLADPARAARDAAEQIGKKLAEACKVTVMHGRPA